MAERAAEQHGDGMGQSQLSRLRSRAARMPEVRIAGLLAACALIGCATPAPSTSRCPPYVTVGLDPDGRPTSDWIDAIRDRVDANELTTIAQTARPLSADEAAWRDLIAAESGAWCASIPRLNAPFRSVTPPLAPAILLGNQGGGDGFTHDPDDVAIDLHEMVGAYSAMRMDARRALIQRLLAHEYTHLLLHRWMDAHGWSEAAVTGDPFRQALRTLYNEGIANYRSIDDPRWVGANGELTGHARETLAALEPVMIERLRGLAAHPSEEEAARLLRNISQGPLERKWGAIPIALWFAEATHGDPARMAAWIERGPQYILELPIHYGNSQYRNQFEALQAAVERGLRSAD
jgi:hypothetical protein